MANVNLYDTGGHSTQQQIENRRRMPLGSLVFVIVSIALSLGAYGGLKVWGSMVNRDISDREAQVKEISTRLMTADEDSTQMHDIFLRLRELKQTSESDIAGKFMGLLERDVIQGVVLSGYTYNHEAHTIQVVGDAVDFNTLSQQIQAFRSDDMVASASLESTGISGTGYILFTIQLSLASNSKSDAQ